MAVSHKALLERHARRLRNQLDIAIAVKENPSLPVTERILATGTIDRLQDKLCQTWNEIIQIERRGNASH